MRTFSRLGLLTGIVSLASVSACSSGADEEVATATAKVETLNFCPRSLVARKDMARYLMKLKRGRDFVPPAPRGLFSDVSNADDQAWAEALFDEGITKGCGAPGETRFCPDDAVPREQMAAFIVRLFHGPDFSRPKTDRFTDVVDGHEIFEGYIEQLADDGITRGCTDTTFCPSELVPREQMAAFLMRAAHRGSPDERRTTRFADVPQDNIFSGRIEEVVDDGIMDACDAWEEAPSKRAPLEPVLGGPVSGSVGGPGGATYPEAGIVGFGQWQRFNFFAKSSIETVHEDEQPPYNSNWGSVQAMGFLTWSTNQSYQEYPTDDWWGASYNSEKFRLWTYLGIETHCLGPRQADLPWLSYDYSAAGTEIGLFSGTHNLDTRIVQEGDGYGVRYVLWGHPDGKLEPSFQAIKGRANKDIFQYGTIHITCGFDSIPRATMDTYEGPSFGGSAFPSHHAWIFAEGDNTTHEKQYIQQARSYDPYGPGMKNLWFLPTVPPPGGVP